VIEAVTGQPLREVLARRILRPLGLDGTELVRTRRLPDLRDSGTNPSLPWAAGGMVSTARDLERFSPGESSPGPRWRRWSGP